MDAIKAKYLRRDADHADQWARQLRDRQAHLLAEADKVGVQAAEVEARAEACRAEAAMLAAPSATFIPEDSP